MSSSGVTIVTTDAERKEFVEFLYTHYKNDLYFVPPLRMDQKKLISTEKNPFFENAEIALFVAEHNGKPAGRISAVVDHRFNEHHNEQTGFFGFFECIDHQPTSDLLFRVAEDWLRDKGMKKVLGPASPGMMDTIGVLVDGFEKYPYIMMPYSKPYYDKLISEAGYRGAMDLLAYIIDKEMLSAERMERATEIVKKRNPGLKIRPVNLKKIKEEVEIVRNIYNEAWKDNWGFLPLTKAELADTAENFKLILDPDLAHIAEIDGKPVAFSIGIPDLNEIFRTMNGNLFPFGIFKLLLRRRKIKRYRTALMGVLPEYRGRGLDAVVTQAAIDKALARGIDTSELSWVLADNIGMQRVAERLGARVDKTYRMYEKDL